jgi:hypothetical protein
MVYPIDGFSEGLGSADTAGVSEAVSTGVWVLVIGLIFKE